MIVHDSSPKKQLEGTCLLLYIFYSAFICQLVSQTLVLQENMKPFVEKQGWEPGSLGVWESGRLQGRESWRASKMLNRRISWIFWWISMRFKAKPCTRPQASHESEPLGLEAQGYLGILTAIVDVLSLCQPGERLHFFNTLQNKYHMKV